ncbi:hypothetical protein Ocin01_11190 [Orchesella cincta]|uniref:Uncharacterized protein n=1 Tax=Orchesella cincta TaxID=48709 RepID=A0A1D2MQW1_ORCCI|nr:hypothetical protein Ocin01_11190 [Orchesella cincta]
MSDKISPTHTLNLIPEAEDSVTLLNKFEVHPTSLLKKQDNFAVLIHPVLEKTTKTGAVLTPANDSDSVEKELIQKNREEQTGHYATSFSIVDKLLKICGRKVYVTNVYSAGATIASLSLLLLYIVKTQANDSSDEGIRSDIVNFVRDTRPESVSFDLDDLSGSRSQIASQKDWNYIEKLGSQENVLHLTVGQGKSHNNHLVGTVTEGALKISGRPTFCNGHHSSTPEELQFKNITHLHLSGMQNCYHYVHLILTKWHFPKVHKVKLHKMLIREEEFTCLRKFIDRHNETLHKVEIDESYICPSPSCDAGMLDFPNHDFQLIITRRRESPQWV